MLILLVFISFITLILVFEKCCSEDSDSLRSSSVKCTHPPPPSKKIKTEPISNDEIAGNDRIGW
jgi:hypothetical protein